MSKIGTPPVVLALAGFAHCAGAGVLADIKTISAFGCYGVAVITSLTMQNTIGVSGARHQTGETVAAQLTPVLEDFTIAAAKTGMLPTVDIISAVADSIARGPIRRLIVDPVLSSTGGYA